MLHLSAFWGPNSALVCAMELKHWGIKFRQNYSYNGEIEVHKSPIICSRLDYCKSLLNNVAKKDLAKLEGVHNCLACVVIKAPRFSTSLPLLKQLHCLLVVYRTKLATIMYCALSTQQPPYLVSFLHFSDIPRNLRSSVPQQLFVPKTDIDIDKCAFSAWQHGSYWVTCKFPS